MGFLRSKVESFEFEGRKVEATIKPIEYGDFLKVESGLGSGAGEVAEMMTGIVRKYAELVTPPVAADGSPVTLDELCKHPYFVILTRAMFTAIVNTGRAPDPKA